MIDRDNSGVNIETQRKLMIDCKINRSGEET